MSILKISKSVCTHLRSISSYNKNYYFIPFEIDGCNVVYEECDEFYNDWFYVLGKLEEGAFKNDGNHIFYSSEGGLEKYYKNIILEDKYKNIR